MKSAGSARATTPHWGAATPDAHSRPSSPATLKAYTASIRISARLLLGEDMR
jgi:hypothetical protein